MRRLGVLAALNYFGHRYLLAIRHQQYLRVNCWSSDGGKINGSGGGGCMFAYAPNNSEAIAEAIKKAGGKSYIVQADEGTIIN